MSGPQLTGLSLRRQLAQLLVVGVGAAPVRDVHDLVRAHQPGGIFLGADGAGLLTGRHVATVGRAARIPLAVGVDYEGGRVQRLAPSIGAMPGAQELAATMTPAQARDLAAQRGAALRDLGVTMNFAPVVDIGGADSALGTRSFGPDPEVVVAYAGAVAEGFRAAGVLPVFKHFPGHGRADGDSHDGLARAPALDALREVDLIPYRRLLGAGPAGVMVAHLDVPGLTDGVAASLSPAAYALLRTEIGFHGPAITDDLSGMRAVSDSLSAPQAALRALRAGADIALLSTSDELAVVLDTLEEAVHRGELPAAKVASSLRRVLRSKGIAE